MPPSFILVVDDDSEVAMMLATYLQAFGHDAEYALDAAQFQAKLSERKPDLIILDFRMPGTNGSALYEQLQKSASTSSIPVIFLSGLLQDEVRSKVPASSRVGFLKKPIDVQALRGLLSDFLPS